MQPAASGSRHTPLAFIALCCGVGVSTIYLCQPLLSEMGATFGANAAVAGQIGVATQVGYALGMLCFVPLGDTVERRSLISRMFAGVAIALLLQACAPSLLMLLVLCALSGGLACVTHIVLPIAPDLAPPEKRGHAIGVAMTGLLLGVLLARTFSGWVADLAAHITTRVASWRIVFAVAALISAALVPAIRRIMPEMPAKQKLSYGEAIRSLWDLTKSEPLLRESCIVGGLIFGAFSSFWNTLAFVMATHGMGAGVTGSFGLVGAAGTMMATIAGKLSDRKGPRYVLWIGIASLVAAYLGIYLTERFATHAQAAGHFHLWTYLLVLAAMVVLLDIGQQSVQLGNQTRIFALQPAARSRINTVYMSSYFLFGALASAISTVLWQHYGITGIFVLQVVLVALAIARHATGLPVPRNTHVLEDADEPMLHM
jgi:predicted MFS family arabinose efflux permease